MTQQIRVRTLIIVMLAISFFVLKGFFVAFAMGTLLSIVINPFVLKFESWKFSRTSAIVVVILGLTALVVVPISVLLVAGGTQLLEVAGKIDQQEITQRATAVVEWFNRLMASPALEEFKSLTKITDAEITQKLISFGQTLLGVLTDSLKGFFQSVPFVALEALVVLATLLVMLIKTGTLREVVLRIFAHNSLQLVRVMKRGEALAHSILTAAVMTAVIQASLIGIAASICGNSHVLGILLLSFLMAFIPVIGTVPISIFLIIQSGVDGNQFAAIVYGVNLLLVGSIDNFIRPLLMSGKNGLHPLLAFVAAIGGVSAFGFYGLFLGPVTIGLTIILIDEMIS